MFSTITNGKIRSFTDPEKTYNIVITTGGFFFCTCPDFQNRKAYKADFCKHLLVALGKMVMEGRILPTTSLLERIDVTLTEAEEAYKKYENLDLPDLEEIEIIEE